jgi:hypothetical protein
MTKKRSAGEGTISQTDILFFFMDSHEYFNSYGITIDK